MRRIGLAAGVILIGGAFMAAATAVEAQEATRVAPFDMLDGPRIGLPAEPAARNAVICSRPGSSSSDPVRTAI